MVDCGSLSLDLVGYACLLFVVVDCRLLPSAFVGCRLLWLAVLVSFSCFIFGGWFSLHELVLLAACPCFACHVGIPCC